MSAQPQRRLGPRQWAGLGVGAALLAGGAYVAWPDGGNDSEAVNLGTLPTRAAPTATAGPRDAVPASADVLYPTRMVIPSLKVDAKVEPKAVDRKGELGVPKDGSVLGWWADGPRPGSTTGTSIIAGHVTYNGKPGALAKLNTIKPGAALTIYDGKRQRGFKVAAVRTYGKNALQEKNAFDPKSPGMVAIVSCTGSVDTKTGHFTDNIIAYAQPV